MRLDECSIESVRFTNQSYTGYISENIGQPSPSQSYPNEPSKRHYQKFDTTKKLSVYVRFVDEIKPSVEFGIENVHHCLDFNFKSLNLSMKTDDYDQDAMSLFEIDYDNYLCTKHNLINCICYFQIRITDDPFVRDRINREAKDKYRLNLLLNDTKASLIVNILDDNDLEPMFDPSEYKIEIFEFEMSGENQLQKADLAEYSIIGKVNAMDPDLAENAHVKYYAKYNEYFGVLPNTGEIYLKTNSRNLFALNISELSMEVKAFDAGIKLNLVNNLMRLNASLFDNNLDNNDANFLDKRLVDMVTKLDRDKISLVSKYLDQVKSFEMAQINVVLVRNLPNLFEHHFSYPTMHKITLSKQHWHNRLVPIKILKFTKKIDFNNLRIDGHNWFMFEFELDLNQRDVLISICLDPALMLNETKQYKIMYCVDKVCIDLIEFEINFLLDILTSVRSMCELSVSVAPGSQFTITKLSEPDEPLFDTRPDLGPSNLCRSFGSLLDYELEIVNNSAKSLKLAHGTQIRVNHEHKYNQSYELMIRARLKNQLYLYQVKRVLFNVNYSSVYDFLSFDHTTQILVDTESNILANYLPNALYLSLKTKNGIYKTNVQHHTGLNSLNFFTDYAEAYLILAPKLHRILIVNPFVNNLIRLRVNQEKSPSQNLLGIFAQPINSLDIIVRTHDPLDSKCFYVDHFYGSLYLKCQLLPSFGIDQVIKSNQVYQRQIDLYHKPTNLLSSIQLEFTIEHDLNTSQDVSIQIEPIKINFINLTTIDKHLHASRNSNTKIKHYLNNLNSNLSKEKIINQNNNNNNISLFKLNLNDNDKSNRFEYKFTSLKQCLLNVGLFRIEIVLSDKDDYIFLFSLNDPNDLFYVDKLSGVVKFKRDFVPENGWLKISKYKFKLELLQTNFLTNTSHVYNFEINLQPNSDLSFEPDFIQVPRLIRQNYYFEIDQTKLDTSNDLLLIKSFDVLPSKHSFNVSYLLISEQEVPFYLDSNGKLFHFNSVSNSQTRFKFDVHLKFKHFSMENYLHEEIAFVDVRLSQIEAKRQVEFYSDQAQSIVEFNLNVPVHTSRFAQMEKSVLIGFVTFDDWQTHKYSFDSNRPVFEYNASAYTIHNDQEENLINENFLQLIQIDKITGAIYFNLNQLNSIRLYTRLSKLIDYFFYRQKQHYKIIKINLIVKNVYHQISIEQKIKLIFYSNENPVWIAPVSVDSAGNTNRFSVNSNNLLNLFRNGDELVLALDIEENAATWPAYLEYHRSDHEGFVINLRDYFKSRLNTDSKTSIINWKILNNTRFYMKNDALFQISDNYNGLVQSKHSIQFDYEIEQSYATKVMLVQYTDSIESPQSNKDKNDLVFKSTPSHFVYYLDMIIRIVNVIDEPFISSRPVYYIWADENETKNKLLLNIDLIDYESGNLSLLSNRFNAEIYSGNAQGLFYMSALGLYTSASSRKLNREAQSRHELFVKIVESSDRTGLNSTPRFALCRIVVNVEDINDHRPIVNDVELDMYDQLDENLIRKIPIANAIAIDQDFISELKYSIVSVKILHLSKRAANEKMARRAHLLNMRSLFVMNATSGALSLTQPQMPCRACSLQIIYRVLDIGRFKNRTSRKSYIRLNVFEKPKTNFSSFSFELSMTPEKTDKIIVLNLNEDVKLGEKVYQVKTNKLQVGTNDKSILYYNLLQESNINLTFYMSNHDGSLYLIKKLDADNGIQFFNLSVLITNWLNQVETVYIEVYVKDTNDNRPEFSSTLVHLNESVDVDANTETSIDLIEATDQDKLDENNLQFRMEDCFYTSKDILFKKPFIASAGVNPSTNHLNYPLCSKQFLALVPNPSVAKSQLLKLKINTIELKNYLDTSSDMFINKIKGSVLFVLDLSVQDSSSRSATMSRVMLNLTIQKQPSLVFKRQSIQAHLSIDQRLQQQQDQQDRIAFGFLKPAYTILIRQKHQLNKGARLLSFFNQFVWSSKPNEYFSFKPYEIKFNILSDKYNIFSIDKNFGLLTLNQSLTYVNKIYEIEIECQVNRSIGQEQSNLFRRTKVYVSVLKSAVAQSTRFFVPFTHTFLSLTAYIDENRPIGSYVLSGPSGDQFDLFHALNLDRRSHLIKLNDENFALEPDTGSIRTKTHLDYETKNNYRIKYEICSMQIKCIDRLFEIEIKILNLNDNEPIVRPLGSQHLHLNRSDLIRSMSLYTFYIQDMDNENNLTWIDVNLFQKLILPTGCHGNENFNMVEMFTKFDTDYGTNLTVLKLTDAGFDFLLFTGSKKQCPSAQIQVLVQATDGLFITLSNFTLSILNEPSPMSNIMKIESNPIVPILHTIEIEEGHVTKSQLLLNLQLVLENYLQSLKFNTKSEFNFCLLNYENLFGIHNDHLFIKSNIELDREQRDTYELFVAVRTKINFNIPKNIRVLIKLNDANDNRPIFVQPAEIQPTRRIHDTFDLYEYNVSCLLDDLVLSTQSNGVILIKAIDNDFGQNGSILYSIESHFKHLMINSHTGSLFYRADKKDNYVPSLIEFNVSARDQGTPPQKSMLKIRLYVLNSTQSVYFKTNFYLFKLDMNTHRVNTTIGHVNSAAYYQPVNSRLIYSILSGDQMQQFYLHPLSGRLSVRKKLHCDDKNRRDLFRLLVEARSELDHLAKWSVWAEIRVEGCTVPRLEFDKFEYQAFIGENVSKMSQIFRLQTSDSNANFKLLNNYDLFYINEITGSVFNKQTFDYESEDKEFYLKIKAYNSLHETYCVLVVTVVNQNDNRPQFDKTNYLSQIEISQYWQHYTLPLHQILINNSLHSTSNQTHQFVSKLTANDQDFDQIEYSIADQKFIPNSLQNNNKNNNNQLIGSNVFSIDSKRGIVYLNKIEFFKFKNIFKFLNWPVVLDSTDLVSFSLKISGNDSKFVAYTQLNVQIKQMEFERAEFKSSLIKVSFDWDKYESKSKVIDLRDYLTHEASKVDFKTWTHGFRINNTLLTIDKNLIINNTGLVNGAVFACDRVQTGLCDQALVEINITRTKPEMSRSEHAAVIGFVSQYGVYSIQQQYTEADYNYMDFVNEYDYYIYEELNDANERFYYELKAFELSDNLKYQFDIVECQYESVNLTISNSTLVEQLKEFSQSRDKFLFSPIQIKYLFLLNRHNGVLSSRKTVNSMQPGVYNFNVSLKLLSKNVDNQTVVSPVMDYMKFRLVVLPTVTSLAKQINKNNFKFEREFYRFKFDKKSTSIGSVRLVPKFNKSISNLSANYKLIGNKFNINDLFEYNEAELSVKKEITIELIKPYLNENNELYLNCLCLLTIEVSLIELMKEVVIDFTSFLNSEPEIGQNFFNMSTTTGLAFTQFNEKIKIFNNLPIGRPFFRLMVTNRKNVNIVFSSENRNFNLDPTSGLLSLNRVVSDRLNVTACQSDECAQTTLDVELIDTFSRVASFDNGNQNGVIREDALPGTVVSTLTKSDKKIDYFIINGDEHNQFDISPDAKVYTRRMLDKETISNYTLTIIAFDGMFKSTINLFVNVLNVDDSRPLCHDNMVTLKLAENLAISQSVHVPRVTSSSGDEDTASLNHQIITDFEAETISESIPFKFNQNTKMLELSAELDYETKSRHTFYLLNSLNKNNKCIIKYLVEVLDINDNRPEFHVMNKTISVYEHSPKGLVLDVDMYTTDLDSTNNSKVYYSLRNNSYFRIDKTNGLIQIDSENLDREVIGDQIKLDILAYNLDNLTNLYSINVNLIDLNDNKPVFEQKEYQIFIKENLPLNTEIGRIEARDADLNSKTEYYVRPSDKFYIDSRTGSLFLNHSVDYEQEKEFSVQIIAIDPEMSTDVENNSTCFLKISLIDLNDNRPIFDPSTPKHVDIDENLPLNSTIMFIKAFDLDQSAPNNKISYRLVNGSDYLQIDEQTGRLYTDRLVIDYEQMRAKNFSILVECRDNGEPQLKSYLTIEIRVQDVNDNEPIFAQQNQTLVLKETLAIGSEITKFLVSDKDSFGQLFTFSIMEQYKKVGTAKIYLSEKIFFMKENSLILSNSLQSNQSYGLRIRCYDSGLPSPLYTDSYVSIIVTDESNTVPMLNNTSMVVTSIDHFAPIAQNQVIGVLKATDADKDILFYEANSDLVEINQLNGLIKIRESIPESESIVLSPRVTDKKFVVEAKLNIKLNRVKPDCLFNSLYAKFVIRHSQDNLNMKNFVQMGYLSQIHDHLQQMVYLRRKTSFNLTIEIIALRFESNTDIHNDIFGFGLDDDNVLFESKSSLVEILFTVKKTTYKTLYSSCINSKYMAKFLNKKKSLLIKKLQNKSNSKFSIYLKDLSFNTKCTTFDDQICSINIQLQTCRLNFHGFNPYNLCDQDNVCYLLPNYDWTCEFGNKIEIGQEPTAFSQECAKNPCQNNGLCKIVKKKAKNSDLTKHKVHCFCPNGFKGKYCEQDVNECVETGAVKTSGSLNEWINPCHPSANCINTQGSYICNCTLEPSSLCYNTLSPQYTASVAAFKNDKNAKYSNSFKQYNKYLVDDFASYEDDDLDLYHDQVTMFGYRIPNHVIQQALLGIFGGICAILVLLSLVAAIMCKINFTKGYIETYEVRHDAMTSNTSVDHDDFTSSSSSPGSLKIESKKQNLSKYKNNRFNRNKQRSSMTASLISSNTVESSDGEQIQRKNFRFRINNLFFSKNQNLKGLPEVNKEESEIESSSAYSPKSLTEAKYKIELKGSLVESNRLLKQENDGDDEDESNIVQGLVRPVNTFGRASFRNKYNTLDCKKLSAESEIEKIKYNTAIKRPKGVQHGKKECSTFLSKLSNQLTEIATETEKGSTASIEDPCHGKINFFKNVNF